MRKIFVILMFFLLIPIVSADLDSIISQAAGSTVSLVDPLPPGAVTPPYDITTTNPDNVIISKIPSTGTTTGIQVDLNPTDAGKFISIKINPANIVSEDGDGAIVNGPTDFENWGEGEDPIPFDEGIGDFDYNYEIIRYYFKGDSGNGGTPVPEFSTTSIIISLLIIIAVFLVIVKLRKK